MWVQATSVLDGEWIPMERGTFGGIFFGTWVASGRYSPYDHSHMQSGSIFVIVCHVSSVFGSLI